jgi:hypothetical protein
MDPDTLADEIQARPDTVKREIRRYSRQFILLQGGKVGLKGTES